MARVIPETRIGEPGQTKKEAERLAARAAILSLLESELKNDLSKVIKSKAKQFAKLNNVRNSSHLSTTNSSSGEVASMNNAIESLLSGLETVSSAQVTFWNHIIGLSLSSTHDEDPPSIIVHIIVVLTSIISYLIVPISISIVDSTIVILVSSPIIVRSRSSLISFIAIRSLALLVPILLVSIPTFLKVMIPLSSIAFLPLIFLPIVTTIASIALIVLKSLV
nr:double-stranded RNA-binding protein 4-like [Ipomoea trifida]